METNMDINMDKSKIQIVNGDLEMNKDYLFLGNEEKGVDTFKFTVLKKTDINYTILVNGLKRFKLKNDAELVSNIMNRKIYEIKDI